MLLECQPAVVKCLTEVRVRAIDQESVLELIAQDHAVGMRIMFEISENERRLHNWGMALGKGRSDERIAAFLLELYRRLHRAGLVKSDRFWMPMPQTEIANHLGMSTEHLNRVLRELRESGIVTVRDWIVAIDRMAQLLQRAAPLQAR